MRPATRFRGERRASAWRGIGLVLALWSGAATSATAQLHDAIQDRLQAQLDSLVTHSAVPGATLGVAFSDGSSFGIAAGMSDTTSRRAMRPEDLMLQGSVGKTYFAAVALQLVAEGRLELDAGVSTYLGDLDWYSRLPNADDITVRTIMNHTSGIVRYELNPAFLEDLKAHPYRTWTPADRLAYLLDAEAPFAAGQGWDYSDTNYILLGLIVERLTGEDLYGLVRRRVLGPLQLVNTVPSDRPQIDGLAQGYAGVNNPFGDFDATLVGDRLALNPQFEWAGGGFASTAEDLAKWATHIHEGRAFDEELLEEVRTGVPAPLGPDASYGLGVIMMELPAGTAWGHSGFMPGYRTEMYYFPEHGFALALQINSTAAGSLNRPLLRVFNDLAQVVLEHLVVTG